MAIISITPYYAGQVDQLITRWKLISTDSLATVTSTGYLNSSNLMGYTVSPNDIFDVIYSYTGSINIAGTGTYVELLPTITFSNAVSVITLNEVVNPGDVLLPVVSGHFANFNGTNGQIKDSGYLPSNAALTRVVMESGASVAGNFPKYNDVTGTLIDSGIAASSFQPLVTSVTLNTAQMAAAYATPAQLIANPLSSQMILVLSATVYTASTGNTAYATGTAPIIQYSSGGTNGAHGAGTIATATGLVAGDITASTSQVRNLFEFATGVQTGLSGLGIYFSNATGAYTAGTGTNVTFTLVYLTLTATV